MQKSMRSLEKSKKVYLGYGHYHPQFYGHGCDSWALTASAWATNVFRTYYDACFVNHLQFGPPLFHYTYTWGCHKPDNSCCLNLLSHLDSVREKLPRKYIDPPWPIFFVHSSLKGWVSPASVKDANTLGTQTFLKDAQQQICETEDLLLVVFQRCPLRWPISCIKAWP